MYDVTPLHKPQWQLVGTDWHMVIGNRSVAKIIPNFDRNNPRFKWLSVLDSEQRDAQSWHAVDFETLDAAKQDIEQWWQHSCRGKSFAR